MKTRAWTKRYRAKKDRLPSMLTAGVTARRCITSRLCRPSAPPMTPSGDGQMREMPVKTS